MSEIQILEGKVKDLGEMQIVRYLPQIGHKHIGPFVFFDHMPNVEFSAGQAMDVRPHPHIGLSTLSYLIEGSVHHRDSLGYDVILTPGDVLLMTSGNGIVHSERSPEADRARDRILHMFQFWLALPVAHEQDPPSVSHALAADLPTAELQPGLHARLALGEFGELRSPVRTHNAPILLDLNADSAGSWSFSRPGAETALYVLNGELSFGEQTVTGPNFVLLPPDAVEIHYSAGSRFLIIGGEPLDGPRLIWWNLVASRRELIEEAKQRWLTGGFAKVPNDEVEFIPLPEEGKVVFYP